MTADDKTQAKLAELGLKVGDLVKDRHGEVREVLGIQTQGGDRKDAIVAKSIDTDAIRRLMASTLTLVPTEDDEDESVETEAIEPVTETETESRPDETETEPAVDQSEPWRPREYDVYSDNDDYWP